MTQTTFVIRKYGPGIEQGCLHCQKVLLEGNWLILIVEGKNSWVLGYNPPFQCEHCGDEKPTWFRIFKSEEHARTELQEIVKHDGHAHRIPRIGFSFTFGDPATLN